MGSMYQRDIVNGNGGIDRISGLPDEILYQILSFLPAKYAVLTCVLSKRWKYLWNFITNLDFDGSSYLNPNNYSEPPDLFCNFVDTVLKNCNSAEIQAFRLHYHKTKIYHYCHKDIDHSRVSGWIGDVISRNVMELDLDIHSLQLPCNFFSCETLTVLKLHTNSERDVLVFPTSFCLPRLKILHIQSDSDLSDDLTVNLFRNCPVLEDLFISAKVDYDRKMVYDVSAPALKRLAMRLSVDSIEEQEHKVAVNAPNLEYLDLHDEVLAEYGVQNMSSLVGARVEVGNCCRENSTRQLNAYRAFELLRGISGVKFLSLYSHTMGTLDVACANGLPTFHNLTRLEVLIHDSCGWNVLTELHILQSSPNLEVFILKKERLSCWFDDSKVDWCRPRSVPNCLPTHLEVIDITGFEGKNYEMKLIKYLLGYAEVLKNLTISCPGLAQEKELTFYRDLVEFPRASRNCRIQLLGRFFSKFSVAPLF